MGGFCSKSAHDKLDGTTSFHSARWTQSFCSESGMGVEGKKDLAAGLDNHSHQPPSNTEKAPARVNSVGLDSPSVLVHDADESVIERHTVAELDETDLERIREGGTPSGSRAVVHGSTGPQRNRSVSISSFRSLGRRKSSISQTSVSSSPTFSKLGSAASLRSNASSFSSTPPSPQKPPGLVSTLPLLNDPRLSLKFDTVEGGHEQTPRGAMEINPVQEARALATIALMHKKCLDSREALGKPRQPSSGGILSQGEPDDFHMARVKSMLDKKDRVKQLMEQRKQSQLEMKQREETWSSFVQELNGHESPTNLHANGLDAGPGRESGESWRSIAQSIKEEEEEGEDEDSPTLSTGGGSWRSIAKSVHEDEEHGIGLRSAAESRGMDTQPRNGSSQLLAEKETGSVQGRERAPSWNSIVEAMDGGKSISMSMKEEEATALSASISEGGEAEAADSSAEQRRPDTPPLDAPIEYVEEEKDAYLQRLRDSRRMTRRRNRVDARKMSFNYSEEYRDDLLIDSDDDSPGVDVESHVPNDEKKQPDVVTEEEGDLDEGSEDDEIIFLD